MINTLSCESAETETSTLDKLSEPCVVVIFGATGDLTARRLIPALYNLKREGLLSPSFACIGFARRDKDDALFREEMYHALEKYSREKPEEKIWQEFSQTLFYHRSEFDNDAGYASLSKALETIDKKFNTKGNRLFYLSTPPSHFPTIVEHLHKHQLVYNSKHEGEPTSRVIVEKPFGHDLESSILLQNKLTTHLNENQIYRIDHWLGKETVQNLLVFRFANCIFESLWNRNNVDHVQMTVSEDLGIGSRGRFFEEAGLLRDIVQNHMLQHLYIFAMEPPVNLEADSIRNEKVKLLNSIKVIDPKNAVRGQYGSALIGEKKILGYREEENVSSASSVETFVAMELSISNWRWNGVPFYLRAGKRLPRRTTEIIIVFKKPPEVLFQKKRQLCDRDVLTIRIQPNEGISLKFNSKNPGHYGKIKPVTMDFCYGSSFEENSPEAYERLVLDAINGDSTLFARGDEVETSWRLVNPLIEQWTNETPQGFPNYPAGSWGPTEADQLIARSGNKWRTL